MFRVAVVLALLSSISVAKEKPLPFDPHTIEKMLYEKKDCQVDGAVTHCKKLLIKFGAITALSVKGSGEIPAASSFVAPHNGGKNLVDARFEPRRCQPHRIMKRSRETMDTDYYECKDVSWEPHH